MNLSYPDPAAEAEEAVESELPAKDVIIAMERLEGNEIRLYAENLEPEEIEAFTYRWQSSQDNENWVDIDGANSSEYVFTLNSINGSYYWRLIVSEKD